LPESLAISYHDGQGPVNQGGTGETV